MRWSESRVTQYVCIQEVVSRYSRRTRMWFVLEGGCYPNRIDVCTQVLRMSRVRSSF